MSVVPPSSAVVADRDPVLLERLVRELGRRGVLVEALGSPAGLTADLLVHARPELFVLDAGLPGLDPGQAVRLVRALKQAGPARVLLVVEQGAPPLAGRSPPSLPPDNVLKAQAGADAIVPRGALVQRGADALGLPPGDAHVDPRRVIDAVLGRGRGDVPAQLEARLDLLSDDMVATGPDGKIVGVFVACQATPSIGAELPVRLTLFGRTSYDTVGKVAWVRGAEGFGRRTVPGVGLWLRALGDEPRTALARLIELREPLTWSP